MTSTLDFGKLPELREKTDRDLIRVIDTELERGLIFANVASTRQSPLYARAEKLHREAGALLTKVYSLGEGERKVMETKLQELRKALDEAPSQGTPRHMAAR